MSKPETEEVVEGQVVEETPEPPEKPQEPASLAAEDPEGSKPTEADLTVRDREDVYRAMDRADELAIIDEIQGNALEVFVYDFQNRGQRFTDLSITGVKECVRILNERGGARIRVTSAPPVTEEVTEPGEGGELESFYRVSVYAEDERSGLGFWGTATEPKNMHKRDGSRPWDKFGYTKALNKAQRNVLKLFIPEELRQTLIATAKKEGKVKVLEAARAPEAELPPPLDTPEAKKLLDKIDAAYEDLKAVNRMALPPGRFNAKRTRAASEIGALKALLGEIESRTEHEKKESTDA